MKKKFSPSYTYPRLILRGYRTYIEFYATTKHGEYKRFRQTFNLNRILNINDRRERGLEICNKIKYWLKAGKCIDDFQESQVRLEIEEAPVINQKYHTPILEALDIVYKLKYNPEKENSNRTNKSHIRRFSEFLKKKRYSNLSINDITKQIIYDYLDYYKIERHVRNNTLNNIIIHLRAMFYTLKERGYMEENPFANIKLYRPEEKIRKMFTKADANTILEYTYNNDKTLFYSIILEYACLIRPSELLKLRFHHLQIEQGIIILPGSITKNGYERIATIPTDFIRFFKEDFWKNDDSTNLIFGEKLQPHPTKSAGKSALYRRHKKVLEKLHKVGKIKDLRGLHYYSWKDTGITQIIDTLGLLVASDQAGHRNTEVTLTYRHKKRINDKIQRMSFENVKDLGIK